MYLMFPLSTYYNAALEKRTNNDPGRVVTMFRICSIFGEACLKAANPVTAINGFRKYGIVQFDRDIFSETDFPAAEVTDQCEQTEKFPQEQTNTAETANDLSRGQGKTAIL
jgi:hypothetical protein